MKKLLFLAFIVLALGVVAHADTFTYTPTHTYTATAVPTSTLTPTTYLQTTDVQEYSVTNASGIGTTTTAIPGTWSKGHYRISVQPVNYTPTTAQASYQFYYIDNGGSITIKVKSACGTTVSLINNPITFSVIVIRRNYD
jgi:hypothetical protein